MIKSVLLHVGLLLLPSALYLAWLFFFRRPALAGLRRLALPEGPWVWLVAIGLALVSASLVALALRGGYDVGASYRPAHYEAGQLIPGRTE